MGCPFHPGPVQSHGSHQPHWGPLVLTDERGIRVIDHLSVLFWRDRYRIVPHYSDAAAPEDLFFHSTS